MNTNPQTEEIISFYSTLSHSFVHLVTFIVISMRGKCLALVSRVSVPVICFFLDWGVLKVESHNRNGLSLVASRSTSC